jgi:type I restriction enzyme S subunit
VPAPPEQRVIAAFLDRQTAKIDTLIAKKDRLIELLQEKRAALISRAVTKGLDPSAPMKDSGVEWLGEIPAHWKVEELNRHWQIIDCKHRTASYVDEGIHIVSTTEVKPGRLDLSQTRKTTYEEYMNLTEGNRLPRRGNIIYTRNASLGSAAYVDTDEPFCMGQDVCLINSYDQNQLFLNYQLNSPVVIQQLEALMVGATFRRINVGQIKKFVIIRPPKEEQQQIAKYLDGVSERIDILVAKINGSMEKLKEYRTTIISAAVTGKIDVRNQFGFIEESSWHEGSHG